MLVLPLSMLAAGLALGDSVVIMGANFVTRY